MNAPTNGHQPNIAEQRRAAYQAAQPAAAAPPAGLPDWLLAMPGRRPQLAAKLRPYLLAAVFGLLVGAAGMGWVAYRTMPIRATQVDRVFVDVNGDGAADLIVSGWVIYGPAPKAGGQ